MTKRLVRVAVGGMLWVAAGVASAQAVVPVAVTSGAAGKAPMFDVVSVKQNKSGDGSIRISMKPDHFMATNVTLKMLAGNAYNIKADLISGLPGWADSDHFDVEAKLLEPDIEALKKLSIEERRPMFQAILVDRFRFKMHTELKTLPVYELVLVKEAPKFKEAAGVGTTADGDPKYKDVGRGGMMTQNTGTMLEMTGHANTMTAFASALSAQMHRTVIDKTGLKGVYDLSLKWAPDDAPQAEDVGVADDAHPSIFVAIQEQLGLKLVSTKGPVETMVVDHVELPAEN